MTQWSLMMRSCGRIGPEEHSLLSWVCLAGQFYPHSRSMHRWKQLDTMYALILSGSDCQTVAGCRPSAAASCTGGRDRMCARSQQECQNTAPGTVQCGCGPPSGCAVGQGVACRPSCRMCCLLQPGSRFLALQGASHIAATAS
jgi:hypothetical protein